MAASTPSRSGWAIVASALLQIDASMKVFTLVVVETEDPEGAQREAHRVLGIASTRRGADYWSIQPLQPRLDEAGLSFAGDTGVIPLERLPRPVPQRLDPAAIVTPNAYWHWRPLPEDPRFASWSIRRERLIGEGPNRAVVTGFAHF